MSLISSSTAQKIINEVREVLDQDLNFINEKGIIIASSDRKRINTYHSGAHHLILNKLSELPIHYDGEYPGARKGDNLPLIIDDQVIGVIGITGDYEKVKKYGQIVKKMTELMIREEVASVQRSMEQNSMNHMLIEWLLLEKDQTDNLFARKAQMLGIDITLPHRIFALSFHVKDEQNYHLSYELNRRINKFLDNQGCVLMLEAQTDAICVVPYKNDETLKKQILAMDAYLVEKLGVELNAGVDAEEDAHIITAHQAYLKALSALNVARQQNKKVCFAKDVILETLLMEITEQKKRKFVKQIFNGLEIHEIERAISLIECLYRNDCSTIRTAQELFIHKNTVQYQLNRLTDRTGYDPRKTECIPVYTIAIMFWKELTIP